MFKGSSTCLAIIAIISLSYISAVSAAIPDEDWFYATVRPKAHMFSWLYGANVPVAQRNSLPLVIWLQGGPGGSSTGFGNFEEIGPLDVNLNPRNASWISKANLLFVDNPVGTGYSFVEDKSAYTKNIDEIAADLMVWFQSFLTRQPDFKTVPIWIFAESYGGKMATAFANSIIAAVNAKTLTVNFKGVALGDSWISPISFVNGWAPFLRATSLVDSVEETKIADSAKRTADAVAAGLWSIATTLWGQTENVVEDTTDNVDFYNILVHNAPDEVSFSQYNSRLDQLYDGQEISKRQITRHLGKLHADQLDTLMNGPIRQKLGSIPSNVTWGGQSGDVFNAQAGDFMKDIIYGVDYLLGNKTKVVVYNGQLDLICLTAGTEEWVAKLKWAGLSNFISSKKTPMYPNSSSTNTGAFVKSYDNFSFYYIMSAGHMVPSDQPEMSLVVLDKILNN